MSVVNGNDVGVYVNNQLIGCLTNGAFNSQNDEIDVTCKDNNGARQVIPGGNKSTITFAGNWNPSSTYGVKELLSLHLLKTRVGVKMEYNTLGEAVFISGYAYLNKLDIVAPLNAPATFSGEFTVDGSWAFGTT
jgi:hypothetical protein